MLYVFKKIKNEKRDFSTKVAPGFFKRQPCMPLLRAFLVSLENVE